MPPHYDVTARPGPHGWELHIPDVGVKPVRALDAAVSTVQDYLTLEGITGDYTVTVIPELPRGVAAAVRAATAAQADADASAALATRLLDKEGISDRDIATLLGR